MSYQPKSEAELADAALFEDGTYDFEVSETSDKPSKKGNDMFTLKLRVFDQEGNSRYLFDYLVMGNPFGERKLRHAANACGLLEIYNSGKLQAIDFLNTMGKVLIGKSKGTPDYPMPKNVVSDYIGREENVEPIKKAKVKPDEDMDDGIPF